MFFTLILSGCSDKIEDGEQAFQRCISCHSMKSGLYFTGPSLSGVFGRKAGSVEGFNYSSAVKESGIVWNRENLDRRLTNPQAFIQGTKMEFEGIADPKIRDELLAILEKETTR